MVYMRDLKSLAAKHTGSTPVDGTMANNHYVSDTLITILLMKNPRITPEEIEVIKAAQQGSTIAFNRLFKKYKSFVDNVLFHYIKDMDEAKDITNIVFLKVHTKLSTFTDYQSFGGWLRIIANHTAVDYLRNMKNKPSVIDDADVRLTSCTSISSNETDIVNRLTYEQLLKEFKKFPEQAQKVCELFYIDNMTSEQISNALKIPLGTVKSHLSRTRSRIKKQFKNQLT